MSRGDFWTRRKAKVEEEARAEIHATAAQEAIVLERAQAEKSDEELLAELGLPDPDTMKAGDDFQVFMAKAVPDRLRRRALRHLWLSNPALANLDGLLDYGEDFTDSATVIENLQTAYQVGKGLTRHVDEMARQAELTDAETDSPSEAPETDAPDLDASPEEDLIALSEEPLVEALPPEQPVIEAEGATLSTDSDMAFVAPRRRMQFHFDNPAGDAG